MHTNEQVQQYCKVQTAWSRGFIDVSLEVFNDQFEKGFIKALKETGLLNMVKGNPFTKASLAVSVFCSLLLQSITALIQPLPDEQREWFVSNALVPSVMKTLEKLCNNLGINATAVYEEGDPEQPAAKPTKAQEADPTIGSMFVGL